MKDEVPSTKKGVEAWLRKMERTNRNNNIRFWLVIGAVGTLAFLLINWMIPA